MSDEYLESAGKNIDDAIKCLSKIIVDQCDGHDEYNDGFKLKIQEAFRSLIEHRETFSNYL